MSVTLTEVDGLFLLKDGDLADPNMDYVLPIRTAQLYLRLATDASLTRARRDQYVALLAPAVKFEQVAGMLAKDGLIDFCMRELNADEASETN